MNLLEALSPLLNHCPCSHVSQFSPLTRLHTLEAIIGDTSVKINTNDYYFYSNIRWAVFGSPATHNNCESARHSFNALLLLPFSMFPDSESQLHHPHLNPCLIRIQRFFFSCKLHCNGTFCARLGMFDCELMLIFLFFLLFCSVFPKILWLYASVSLGRNILMLICSQCGFENIPGVVFDSSSSPCGVVAGIVSAAVVRQNRRKS